VEILFAGITVVNLVALLMMALGILDFAIKTVLAVLDVDKRVVFLSIAANAVLLKH
jgi:hypothetical protein